MKPLKILIILIIALSIVGGVYANSPDPENTAAYWTFDEGSGSTAFDSTSGEYHGTLSNSGMWDSGLVGSNSLSFTGGDFVDGFSTLYTDVSKSQTTIGFWFKIPSEEQGNVLLLAGFQNPSDGNRFKNLLQYDHPDNGRLQWYISNQAGSTNAIIRYNNFNTYLDGEWHHVVAVFNGTATGNTNRARLYVNGQLLSQDSIGGGGTVPTDWGTSGTEFVIGRDKGDVNRDFVGNIDEMAMFDVVLTQEEVEFLYADGSPTSAQQYPFITESNLTFTARNEFNNDPIEEFNITLFYDCLQTTTSNVSECSGIQEVFFDDNLGVDAWEFYIPDALANSPMIAFGTLEDVEYFPLPVECWNPEDDFIYIDDTQNDETVCYWAEPGDPGFIIRDELIAERDDFLGVRWDYTSPGTVYEAEDGSVVTEIQDDDGLTYKAFFQSMEDGGYFNQTIGLIQPKEQTIFQFVTAQAYVTFTCSERFTDEVLECDEGVNLPRNAGSYEDVVNVTGYYSKEVNYTITNFENKTVPEPGFFNHKLNITAEQFNGTELLGFNTSITSQIITQALNKQTSTGTVTYGILQGYNYTIALTPTQPQTDPINMPASANITIEEDSEPTSSTYQFNLTAARKLNITTYAEENLALFDSNATITLEPISDDTNLFFQKTAENGQVIFENVPVGSYEIRGVVSGNTTERAYITLTPFSFNNIGLYFRPQETGLNISFNVQDTFTENVGGAIVLAQRYYNGTGWVTVGQRRTNIDGEAIMNLLAPDTYYKFLVRVGGQTRLETQRTQITSGTYTMTIGQPGTAFQNLRTFQQIDSSISVEEYPNGTRYFKAVWNDNSGTSGTYTLQVFRRRGLNTQLVGETSMTTMSGTMTFDIPNLTGEYEARLRVSKNPTQTINTASVTISEIVQLAQEGIVFVLLFVAALGLSAAFSTAATIIMSIFGVIIGFSLGFIIIPLAGIVTLIILGAIIIFKR